MLWKHPRHDGMIECFTTTVRSTLQDRLDPSICSFFAPSSSLSVACCGDCCVGGASSLNMNSSKNLTVASIGAVVQSPVSKPPSPRCPFRSPSSLDRFQNRDKCTSSSSNAFVEDILPVFKRSRARARRRGNVALLVVRERIVLLKRERNSSLDEGGTRDGGRGLL